VIRIGIADDEDLVRDGIAALLSRQSGMIVVSTVSNAAEAVDLARSGGIDILLLDIDLGGRGGIEALQDIADGGAENVRVLMVSSFPEEEYALRSIRSGAAGYVRKTANPEELLKAIRTLATGKRYVTEEVLGLMSESIAGKDDEPHLTLSDREYQVFRLLGEGNSVGSIAESLHLSVSSVSTYRQRILEKLQLQSTAAIIHYAARHNIV
jgi:two-component system, NarL family, invasion response regulator UvrY